MSRNNNSFDLPLLLHLIQMDDYLELLLDSGGIELVIVAVDKLEMLTTAH